IAAAGPGRGAQPPERKRPAGVRRVGNIALGASPLARGGGGLGIRLFALPGAALSPDRGPVLSRSRRARAVGGAWEVLLLGIRVQLRGFPFVVSYRSGLCRGYRRLGFLSPEALQRFLGRRRGQAGLGGNTAGPGRGLSGVG